eukprot:CAMPEP_0178374800 /NCGR_PEP_ID=MMETSP0689_2-20121128/2560_1 /TAXON_ID=160604 /ORGANISM="Amphidinium massartii, Strain CS-259" /LENGTH=185 /DNA_ID=CAMNT_0019994775 /DNA_START=525 /DNA_END=1079 /DNA_ORIENTATION=+
MTAARGTPLFMDPVYAETQVLTAASDVYSTGVVLFQLLTGAETLVLSRAFRNAADVAMRWEGPQRAEDAINIADSAVSWSAAAELAVARGLHSLGVQCTDPSREGRPASTEAFETLQGLSPPAPREAAALPRECLICMTASREGRLQPCGHNVMCQACFGAMRQLPVRRRLCPVCRTPFQSFEAG